MQAVLASPTEKAPTWRNCLQCLDQMTLSKLAEIILKFILHLLGDATEYRVTRLPRVSKTLGHHFWYSSARWTKITPKVHMFVTFRSWRNDNLTIMYNYKPCILSINSIAAKNLFWKMFSHVDNDIWFYIFCFHVCKTEYSIPSLVMRFEVSG